MKTMILTPVVALLVAGCSKSGDGSGGHALVAEVAHPAAEVAEPATAPQVSVAEKLAEIRSATPAYDTGAGAISQQRMSNALVAKDMFDEKIGQLHTRVKEITPVDACGATSTRCTTYPAVRLLIMAGFWKEDTFTEKHMVCFVPADDPTERERAAQLRTDDDLVVRGFVSDVTSDTPIVTFCSIVAIGN